MRICVFGSKITDNNNKCQKSAWVCVLIEIYFCLVAYVFKYNSIHLSFVDLLTPNCEAFISVP